MPIFFHKPKFLLTYKIKCRNPLVITLQLATLLKTSQGNFSNLSVILFFYLISSAWLVLQVKSSLLTSLFCCWHGFLKPAKGPVKLFHRVKIAHSFLQSVSNLFHFIIFILPMYFYTWPSENFSKATSRNGKIDRFNL